MNAATFYIKLFENGLKGYVVERSRRIIEIGSQIVKCKRLEDIMAKLDVVYDNIDSYTKWTETTRTEYFASFNSALEYFPDLKSKVSEEYWTKFSDTRRRKRKFVNDKGDDNVVMHGRKKLSLTSPVTPQLMQKHRLHPSNPASSEQKEPHAFYELSMNTVPWKVHFVRNNDDVLVYQRSSKVKFHVNNTEDTKIYVVRVLETLLKEAFNINPIIRCNLKYGQDNMNDITIHNAMKNMREVATHVWTEMVEPFYKVTMT